MALMELTAYWGNDDVDSTIKLSKSDWEKIQCGIKFEVNSKTYYEGEEIEVHWIFNKKRFSIFGEDGAEYVSDESIENLIC